MKKSLLVVLGFAAVMFVSSCRNNQEAAVEETPAVEEAAPAVEEAAPVEEAPMTEEVPADSTAM